MERADDVYTRNFDGKGEDRVRGLDRIVCLCFGGSLDGQYVEIPATTKTLAASVDGKILQPRGMTRDELAEFAGSYRYYRYWIEGDCHAFSFMIEEQYSMDDMIQGLIKVYSLANAPGRE